MKSEGKPGLIIFHELAEQTAYMSDAEFGQLCRAMISYSESGTVPQNTESRVYGAFSIVKSTIDRTNDNYERKVAASRENGIKGGRPRKSQQNPEVISEPVKANSNRNLNKNQNSKNNKSSSIESGDSPELGAADCLVEKPTPSKSKKTPSPIGQYKNVFLTNEELEKLKCEFPNWQKRIDRLSEYMAVSGKAYDNHFAVIMMWAREEKEKASVEKKESFEAGEHEIDAVRKLIKQRKSGGTTPA